jgi:BspA type Leucine rich repeat region (6 copies)
MGLLRNVFGKPRKASTCKCCCPRRARLRNVLASGLLLLAVLPAAVQGQFTYSTNRGTLTITGYTGVAGVLSIPSTINGLSVTSIGDAAFETNTSVTGVTMPDSITDVGNLAFLGCTNLTRAILGNGVTRIGDNAFGNCGSLSSLAIPNSLKGIGNYSFFHCANLTNVTIPDSVLSIGVEAFGVCASLTSVAIPSGVTNLGFGAFDACAGLTSINVDAGNSVYSSANGVLFNKSQTTLITFPGGVGGSYTIPATVYTIGNIAFDNCANLTNVTIPHSVTNIGIFAFHACSRLVGITIPSGVGAIEDGAFSECSGLTSIIIPDEVTSIGSYAFASCSNLVSVTVGTSLVSIGSSAFSFCERLTSVYFQGNAPSVDFRLSPFSKPATIYCLPGRTGWGTSYLGAVPVMLWRPQIQTGDANLGVRSNQFGFCINWASRMSVVVEATRDLVNPNWHPLSTNSITGAATYFGDPEWGKYSSRFYRLRWLPSGL